MNKIRMYCWLFGINLFISAFTFGGGYVVIPMIKKYYVDEKGLFDEEELMNIAAIAQSSPGAIAINMSALAGYRVAGWQGLMISCFASILPPLVILSIVSAVYSLIRDNHIISAVLKGMEAGVAALIVDLIIDMYALILKENQLFYTLLVPIAFVLNYVFHVNVAVIIIGTLVLCVLKYQLCKGGALS